jgi:SsrA-binding protein
VNLIEHKKARLDYEILEEYEAGLELLGYEVKSLRSHHGKLEGSHIIVRDGEAYLWSASIPPYQPANTPKEYDPSEPANCLNPKRDCGACSI